MFNKIILLGNLTKDIELRYAQSGTAVSKTSIATSHKYTVNGERKEDVCFIDITFFGRSAEVANQYLKKGSKILVEGRLIFDQWTDTNGTKRSKHSVTVETMQMLGTNPHAAQKEQEQSYQGQSYQAPNHTDYQHRPAQRAQPDPNALPLDIDEDEIPF